MGTTFSDTEQSTSLVIEDRRMSKHSFTKRWPSIQHKKKIYVVDDFIVAL